MSQNLIWKKRLSLIHQYKSRYGVCVSDQKKLKNKMEVNLYLVERRIELSSEMRSDQREDWMEYASRFIEFNTEMQHAGFCVR